MIRNEENLEDSRLPFLIHPQAEAQGQLQFCQSLITTLFEKGDSPCRKEFSDVKVKRQLLEHYLKSICSLTSQYGIYTKEINSPNAFHDKYLIQTDEVDIECSKIFTEYIKNIQHQNSQRANSIFTKRCILALIAIKKRASHPSSIRELDSDLRKLVDKLERAKITMKLETEN